MGRKSIFLVVAFGGSVLVSLTRVLRSRLLILRRLAVSHRGGRLSHEIGIDTNFLCVYVYHQTAAMENGIPSFPA